MDSRELVSGSADGTEPHLNFEVHPKRGDPANPIQGVFATRSPDRPNPIGLHEVEVLAIDGASVHVRPLEAVHGTPIVDIKPVL